MIILDVMDFDEGMLSVFEDFDCRTPYDPKNYEVELNDWARTESTKWLKYGTKVWLYFLPGTKRLVGYSSLGETKWRGRDKTMPPKRLVIPAIAINAEFRGEPDGVPKDERYASQIMSHVLFEATQWHEKLDDIGLFVHPANTPARKLYSRFEFHEAGFTNKDGYVAYTRQVDK